MSPKWTHTRGNNICRFYLYILSAISITLIPDVILKNNNNIFLHTWCNIKCWHNLHNLYLAVYFPVKVFINHYYRGSEPITAALSVWDAYEGATGLTCLLPSLQLCLPCLTELSISQPASCTHSTIFLMITSPEALTHHGRRWTYDLPLSLFFSLLELLYSAVLY